MTAPDPLAAATGPRSVAAHTIGTAVTGDLVLPPVVLASARDTPAPPECNNLGPRPVCVGRAEELAWLRRVLDTDGSSAVTQSPTVHGLGGIGKTTLALSYAHLHRTSYTLLWWIHAESPARIEQSLAALAARLAPAWAPHASEREQATWALNWLHWHQGWLLVLDNAEDPRDLHPYLGSLTGGHLLVTTRRATGWPRGTPTRALGVLAPDEAAALLCGPDPDPRELREARLLAADLGHLPLALDQAGAYLARNRTVDIAAYRRRLGSKLDKAADGVDARRTIARVWTQTLAALADHDPLAVTVLHTLAWLAPDDIPVTLLSRLTEHEDTGEDPDEDAHEDAVAEALGTLASYSMVTLTPTSVGIHRLVQTVLRGAPDRPGRAEAEDAVARALDDLPEPDGNPSPAWDAVLPHLIALAGTAKAEFPDALTTDHYQSAAQYLHDLGHSARAIPLLLADLALHERTLGETHLKTLTCRHNLAYAYEEAGDLGRALPLLEGTLAAREEVLGPLHPSTLVSRNNLASAYRSAGDFNRALPLLKTTLTQHEQVLGPLAPDTLSTRNNLASAYRWAGDLNRALPLLKTTLTQYEQVLGPDDPATLVSRNNLASAYLAAGDLDRAVPLLETTLTQSEQVLGPTHRRTLTSRDNLATAYLEAGDLDRAVRLLEAVLAEREQLLGEDHPDTVTSRRTLAFARKRRALGRSLPEA
ncbi:tetratricopeptide repeat protein [Kitasatospora sp. NPDC059327]|uniref:tetratricopeptide repeat protein n=1 Tax=Kitasatospora sp. NPDC059327 TaxID=3346803 RepID=UPI0036B0A274